MSSTIAINIVNNLNEENEMNFEDYEIDYEDFEKGITNTKKNKKIYNLDLKSRINKYTNR